MDISVEKSSSGRLLVNTAFSGILKASGVSDPESLWKLQGDSVKKALKERGTERVVLRRPDGSPAEAFLKRYRARPLKEIVKSALSLKFKHFGAFDEWESLLAFHRLGLPTIEPIAAARCKEGECTLTLGVGPYVRASELLPAIKSDRSRRRAIVRKIAGLAARMHSAGMAHQDFYLVHVFILEADEICLIDLQRVLRSENLPERWIVKDLGQMLHSASGIASNGEKALFFKVYREGRGLGSFEARSLAQRAIAKAASIERRSIRKRKA